MYALCMDLRTQDGELIVVYSLIQEPFLKSMWKDKIDNNVAKRIKWEEY